MILYYSDYTLTFRLTTRQGDPEPAIVLRRFLKHALRAWGLRCLRIEPAGAEPTAVEADGAAGPGDR
jgi:hypothetical protein